MKKTLYFLPLLPALLIFVLLVVSPENARADHEPSHPAPNCSASPDGTPNPDFKIENYTLLADVVLKVKEKLTMMSMQIYAMITANLGFMSTISALVTIYIASYGIMFMTGLIQTPTYDFITRMVKLGIVLTFTNVINVFFFNDNFIRFFNQGTDDLIYAITLGKDAPITTSTASGLTSTAADTGNSMMSGVDIFLGISPAVGKVLSGRMFLVLAASLITDPPRGAVFFAMLTYAIMCFLRAVVTATWIYIMSMVVRTLFIGLAPVFVAAILFERTKYLFINWVNLIISACLQPVLIFSFLTFFVKLAESPLNDILRHEICFSKTKDWQGSTLDVSAWQFMTFTGSGWKPNMVGWELPNGFPIELISIISFLMISVLINKFNELIMSMSNTIAQASTNLSGVANPVQAISGSMFNAVASDRMKKSIASSTTSR